MVDPRGFLPESEMATPIVRAPGEGTSAGVLGGEMTYKVESAQTGGAYAIIEQRVPPGSGPPLHVHRHESEIFYVLAGTFEITVGGQKFTAPAGALAALPRDIPHKFKNVGSTEGRVLLTIIPGRFAEYFLELDCAPNHDSAAIERLSAKYDIEILE